MRHQPKKFVPPTVQQTAEALGETDNVSMDHLPDQTKTNHLFFNHFS